MKEENQRQIRMSQVNIPWNVNNITWYLRFKQVRLKVAMIKQNTVNSIISMHGTHLSHLHVSKMNMANSGLNFQIQRQFFSCIYHLNTFFNILQSSIMCLSFHQYGSQQINYTCIFSVKLTLEIVFKNLNRVFNLTTFFVELIESSTNSIQHWKSTTNI